MHCVFAFRIIFFILFLLNYVFKKLLNYVIVFIINVKGRDEIS